MIGINHALCPDFTDSATIRKHQSNLDKSPRFSAVNTGATGFFICGDDRRGRCTMAGDWIKYRDELRTHPRFLSLCDELVYGDKQIGLFTKACGEENLPINVMPPSPRSLIDYVTKYVTIESLRDVTLCALLRVWSSVNSHCKIDGSDAILSPSTIETIDDIAGIFGFGESLQLVGWVLEDSPNSLRFTNFCDFNTPACMRSDPKTSAERKRDQRARERTKNGGVTNVTNVTNVTVDQRRSEKIRTAVLSEQQTADETADSKNLKGLLAKAKITKNSLGDIGILLSVAKKLAVAGYTHFESEEGIQHVVGIAQHVLHQATIKPVHNPAGLFSSLVSKAKWDQITEPQYDSACELIKKHRGTQNGQSAAAKLLASSLGSKATAGSDRGEEPTRFAVVGG